MVTIMKRLNIYVYMATELSNTVVMLHSQNVGRMGQTEKKKPLECSYIIPRWLALMLTLYSDQIHSLL